MESLKETTGLYQVERRVRYAERSNFRITELQIGPTQEVPWHYHNDVQDTFYLLSGAIRVLLANPEEEVTLTPGQTYSVPSKRPHRVANAGDVSAVFFVLQGVGAYDFCPLPGASHSE
jgi:mannose-6-phosphate isomerase-like protein (cupin superfamily)